MSNTENEYGYLGIQIEEATKKKFAELCKEKGSNMSVEIKRFIYEQLKENNK